jgi:hypothetical protein
MEDEHAGSQLGSLMHNVPDGVHQDRETASDHQLVRPSHVPSYYIPWYRRVEPTDDLARLHTMTAQCSTGYEQ